MADDTAVFRFADLPAELKVKVYEQYFAGTELQLCHFDDKKDNFYFSGMPSLALELTGKAICAESRMVRARLISTTILVTEESFVEKTMVKLVFSQKYAWIRNHIRRLKLGLVHSKRPENQRKTARSWRKLVSSIPYLESVDLVLPCGIMSAPVAREDFPFESLFQKWLGHSVREMVDPGITVAEFELIEGWCLEKLATALNAHTGSDKDKTMLNYRRWAMSPLISDEHYFFLVSGYRIFHALVHALVFEIHLILNRRIQDAALVLMDSGLFTRYWKAMVFMHAGTKIARRTHTLILHGRQKMR